MSFLLGPASNVFLFFCRVPESTNSSDSNEDSEESDVFDLEEEDLMQQKRQPSLVPCFKCLASEPIQNAAGFEVPDDD